MARSIERNTTTEDLRVRLLADVPVSERRFGLAGIPTAVLEGGEGQPVVLLHEQGEFAARWIRLFGGLAATNHVIAPDLPGHGASGVGEERLDAQRALSWLADLIEQTCPSPPVVVGHMLSGALAARFAINHGDRLRALVLIDTFGLRWFRPRLRLAVALARYVGSPSEASFDRLYQHCAVDLDGMRAQMGSRWEPFRGYAVDRARSKNLKAELPALMRAFALRPIPRADLARIAVPTTLIWGRHDPATRLRAAQAASSRYGWPLHVIDDAADDPYSNNPRRRCAPSAPPSPRAPETAHRRTENRSPAQRVKEE